MPRGIVGRELQVEVENSNILNDVARGYVVAYMSLT